MTVWSRFMTIFTAAALMVGACGMAVNYFVDVAHVYRGDTPDEEAFIKNFVDELRHTSNGVPLPPFEREVKIELADNSHADCFVTGSSHEMRVSLAEIGELRARCRGLMNLAVSGGSYEDFVTMAAVASKQPGAGTIYVGISPWFFRFDADERYRLYENDYIAARHYFGLEDRGTNTGSNAKLRNLINGQYFARNIGEVIKAIEAREFGVIDPEMRMKDEQLLQPDGSIRESEERRRYLAARKIPDIGPAQKGIGTYKFDGQHVDAALLRDFRSVIEHLHDEKMNVIFVMSPYHPSVFACTNRAICQWLAQTEEQICDLARELHIRTIGSYRPDRFGLTWRDFNDDHHVTRGAVGRYWRGGCVERPAADLHAAQRVVP